jgi:hypothetical protein
MRPSRLSLPFLASFGLAVLIGCGGASGGDDPQSGNGALSGGNGGSAVTADTPITVQNYLNHPKIKAIRDKVNSIDNAPASGDFDTQDKSGCEETITKLFGNHGVIFEITESSGEGAGSKTQAYYDSDAAPFGMNGKLLFIFEVIGTQESRVYFDAQGNKIWQVVRKTGGADRLPVGNEVYQPDPLHSDPDKWFASVGGPDC